MGDTFNEILPDDDMRESSPRGHRSREDRLMSRFYEPLVLLHVLDRYGEQRISRCPSGEMTAPEPTRQELRRDFLDQLAYVCDYMKGGYTVTAIALQAKPSGVVFWVACNTEFGLGLKSRCFLSGALDILSGRALSVEHSKSDIEDNIAEWCIKFNLTRIKEYRLSMIDYSQKCMKILRRSKETADTLLIDWLKSFEMPTAKLPELCRYAYEQRSSPHLRELNRHIGDEIFRTANIQSKRQFFLLTRHFIGRLGSHIKASKVLAMAAWRLPDIFYNFSIETRPSPIPALTPPPMDGLTTLEGIIKRMLPRDSTDLKHYQEALLIMDTKFKIKKRFLDAYKDKNFKPKVHAELILLEYFYKKDLHEQFVDNDRFIGCSKPACYCCYHYIFHHPGDFVRPSTHGKRYLNWRPPDEDDMREPNLRRNIMNAVNKRIRRDALRQIEQCRGPSLYHPDSTSGITPSMNRDRLIQQAALARAQAVRIDGVPDEEVTVDAVLNREREYGIATATPITLSYLASDSDGSESNGYVSP